jgi:cytoskeleton protein RodZ
VKAWGVAGVTFALASAAMYWWVFVRPAPPAASAAARKEAVSSPAPRNLAAAPVPSPEPVAAPREAPRVVEEEASPGATMAPVLAAEPAKARAGAPESASRPSAPPEVVAVNVAAPVPPRPPGTRTVTLRFKGSSWVEIKDRSGKVLLSKLNSAGSEAEVSGRPPFSVVVGNAPDVTMLYDDREFPLEPHTRVAVARFTLE